MYSLLVLAVILSGQMTSSELLTVDYLCPTGSDWGMMRINTILGLDTGPLCYLMVNATSFQDALTYCHKQQASVFSLSSPYASYVTVSESEIALVDLLAENGVTKIWHGIYVEDSRFVQDMFPMTQTRDPSFSNTVLFNVPWETAEPSGTSNCFEIAINLTSCAPNGRNIPSDGNEGSGLEPKTDQPNTTTTMPDKFVPEFSRRKRWSHFDNAKVSAFGRHKAEAFVRAKRQTGGNAFEEPASCQGRRVVVRSRQCQDPLPFVCVKNPVRKRSTILTFLDILCQPDEFGNYKFNRCFSYGHDGNGVSSDIAQERCETKDDEEDSVNADGPSSPLPSTRHRTLYRPYSQWSSSFLNERIADTIYSRLRESEFEVNPLAWVGRLDTDRSACRVLDLGSKDIKAWNCSAQLPFYICQHRVDLPDVSNLVVRMKTSEIFNPKTSDIAGSSDIQYSVPYRYTDGFSNIRPVLSCIYNSPLVPALQSVTLMKNGIPKAEYNINPTSNQPSLSLSELEVPFNGNSEINVGSQRSLINFVLQNHGSFSEDLIPQDNITDYYWCELNNLKTGKIRQSERVFVRTLEVGVYAVSLVLEPIRQPRSIFLLYSLYGEADSALNLSQALRFSSYSYRVLRCRPELVPKGSNRIIVDLLFFNNTRGQSEFRPSGTILKEAEASIRSGFLRSQETLSFSYKVDLATLRVRSIDICPQKTVYDPVSDKRYEVPDTPLGETYSSPEICLANGVPYVTLKCRGDKLYGASWSRFEPNNGCNFDSASNSSITNTLKNISESTINDETVDEVVTDTKDIVSSIDNLAPVDIVYIADIFQKATQVDNVTAETGRKLLEIVDRVSNTNNKTLEESNKLGNATNRILRAVDELGDKIVLDDVSNVRVVTSTTALEVWNITKVAGDVIIGLELRLDDGEPVLVLGTNDLVSLFESNIPEHTDTDAAILLPGALVRDILRDNPGKDVRLSMNVFADTALFRLGRLESRNGPSRDTVLNSKVISAKITVDGVSISNLDNNVVTTVYLPIVALPKEQRAQNSTCVFWDFRGDNGQGAWSDVGCRYDRTLEGRDVCVCDHLTNFAVLLDVYGQDALPQEHQLALSVISIIGLSLSIAGLSATVLSFLLIKKLRQGKPQQTLFNMALAMLASWIIFLAGFSRVESHVGCLVVAVLLHYFILASFMWMLMEGFLQYLLFVKVLGNDFHNYMLKSAIPAWGLPLIPVVVILAIDTELYKGGDQYCWMSLTPFYYAFLAPVALVMLINIVVYVMVVMNICRRSKVGSSSTNKNAVGIRASVACFIALGLSWVFAFFAIEDARVIFQYLFTITTSLQGLLIFLIFTARDPNVRAYWRNTCCRGRKSEKSSTNTNNRYRHQNIKTGDTAPQKSTGSDVVQLSRSAQSNGSNQTSPTSVESASSQPGMGFPNHAYDKV